MGGWSLCVRSRTAGHALNSLKKHNAQQKHQRLFTEKKKVCYFNM